MLEKFKLVTLCKKFHISMDVPNVDWTFISF
jgi:hypothetical protein